MVVVGITGMPGSGKSLAAQYLVRKGFEKVEMGDVVREEMRRKKIRITNRSIREFSLLLRKKFGNDVVAKLALRELRKKKGNIVIVGLRGVGEIKYFRKRLKHFYVIALVAPKLLRYKRLRARGREDDPKNMKEFEFREAKEKRYGIDGAIRNADFVVSNTASVKQLKRDLDFLLNYIITNEKKRKMKKGIDE
ncbi:MAG: AAA family ATPase [Candidatus Micrarchaeota archaeon]